MKMFATASFAPTVAVATAIAAPSLPTRFSPEDTALDAAMLALGRQLKDALEHLRRTEATLEIDKDVATNDVLEAAFHGTASIVGQIEGIQATSLASLLVKVR